ncbi:MAG: methyltransferase domain-containing protein [Methylococcaceae bacterium]|nr:methyltransferase domain-containing protein [Methylococcaceae bacterium]
MSNKPVPLLHQAQQLLKPRLHDGAISIDATVGNGHDTLFLAQHIAPTGRVYGFDIQAAAITATRVRLEQAGLLNCSRLILSSHAFMGEQIPTDVHGKINAIMFNLGYLPGADKQLITLSDSSLAALNSALDLLAPQGMLTVLAYPGHAGGATETAAVHSWSELLDQSRYSCTTHHSNHPTASAPRLLVIEKLN